MTRSMLSYSSLLKSFWGYAIQRTTYILNVVPSKFIPKTPLELWSFRKPSLKYIRIWGCPVHMLKGNTGKLEPHSKVCFFVGYAEGTRGGAFYNSRDNNVFLSTNATFLENSYMTYFKPQILLKGYVIAKW